MNKVVFIVLFMVGLVFGQDSTVNQAVNRFSQEMTENLNDIENLLGKKGTLKTISKVLTVTQPERVKLVWDSNEDAREYIVFYIQGKDTTLMQTQFNFINGANYNQVWDWWISSTPYNYCHVDLKALFPVSYVRLGVIPVGFDSVPSQVTGVRIQ